MRHLAVKDSQASKQEDTAQCNFLIGWELQIPYQRQRQRQQNDIGNDVRNRLSVEEFLNIQAMTSDRLPIPEIVNGCTLKYDDELASNPPSGRYDSHGIECPCEPNLLLHLCSMLCEYACVEEEDGEFDYGDGRCIEVFEYIEYIEPFFGGIRTRNGYVFTKVIVDGCLSRRSVLSNPAEGQLTYL